MTNPVRLLVHGANGRMGQSLQRLCLGRTAIIASHSAAARARLGRVLEISGGRAAGSARQAQG